jgi:hypothetical protein
MTRRVREASTIALALCPDCGGRLLQFKDAEGGVFAQAHLGEEWVRDGLVPALLDPSKGETRH